jgi:hypothetical protein
MRRSGPTAVLRFEELIRSDDPIGLVGRALDDVGVPLTRREGEVPSFEQLQTVAAPMFRRGKIGAWREEMPAEIEERFWELHGDEMEALGYSRDHPQ